MRNTYIYTETKKLIKKYGTRDPFEIMDQMNIVVGETSRYKTLKPIWDQVLLNGMYTALYAEPLLKRAHKAIQKWSAKNVAVHWRYL